MKKTNRIFALIMALVLLTSIIPVSARAANIPELVKAIKVDDITVSPFSTSDYYVSDGHIQYRITPVCTLELSDDTTETIIGYNGYNGIYIDGTTLYPSYSVDQSDWEPGNTYAVEYALNYYDSETGEYNAYITTSFNVTIEESPVKSIEFFDRNLIEGVDGNYNREKNYFKYDYTTRYQYIVTMQDGSTLLTSYTVDINGKHYRPDYYGDNQAYSHWAAGETHTITAVLAGRTDTFDVTIEETPVKNLNIKDITIFEDAISEYQSSHFNPQTGKYETGYYYNSYLTDPQFTAELKDGSIKEGSWRDDNDKYFNIDFNSIIDTQCIEPWQAGGTYTVSASLAGVTDTFNVTVVENPKKVVSIDMHDMYVMYGSDIYGANASSLEAVDFKSGNRNSNGDYTVYSVPSFSFTLKDGTVQNSENGFIYKEGYGIGLSSFKLNAVDPDTVWQAGGTYEVIAEYKGVTDTFNVTVLDSCVENIEFNDLKLIENGSGREAYYYNKTTGKGEYFFKYEYCPTFTVTFEGGYKQAFTYPKGVYSSSVSTSGGYGGGGFSGMFPNFSDDQDTEHWQLGGTYTATGSFMGVSDTFNVTIIENPVVEIKPSYELNFNENEGGYWKDIVSSDSNLEKKFCYYLNGLDYDVMLKDGSTVHAYYGEYTRACVYGQMYTLYLKNSSVPLEPGNNTFTAELNAFGTVYNVDITANVNPKRETISKDRKPVKLNINDIKVFKSLEGKYNIAPSFTLVYDDGSVAESKYSNYYMIGWRSWCVAGVLKLADYDTKEWEVGETYKLSGYIDGTELTDDFSVTVIDNPIIGIVSTSSIQLLDDRSFKFNDSSKSFVYSHGIPQTSTDCISIKLKDGSTAALSGDGFWRNWICIYNNYYNLSKSYNEVPSKVNKMYSCKIGLNGYSYTCEEQFITADMVESISVLTLPSKTEYEIGESLDVSGMTVAAKLTDGSVVTVGGYSAWYNSYNSMIGENRATVSFGGKIAYFNVTVKPYEPSVITSDEFSVDCNIVSRIAAGTTVEALLNGINEGSKCKVYLNGDEVSSGSKLCTGMEVRLIKKDETYVSYTAVVTGDTDGDGNITLKDSYMMKQAILAVQGIGDNSIICTAADVNHDGIVNTKDSYFLKLAMATDIVIK